MRIVKNKYGTFIEPDFRIIENKDFTEELNLKQYTLCQRITISLVGGLFGALLLGNVFMYLRALCCNLWVKHYGYEVINVVVG